MSHRLITLAALAAFGCDADLETPMDQAPPAGDALYDFVVSEAMSGTTATLTWAFLEPGTRVKFFVTPDGEGAGPCPAALGGSCLDIVGAVQGVGRARADANGVATITIDVPASVPNQWYQWQAAGLTPSGAPVVSNVFWRSTGLGFCTFIFRPVCGIDGVTYDNECLANVQGVPGDYDGFCI